MIRIIVNLVSGSNRREKTIREEKKRDYRYGYVDDYAGTSASAVAILFGFRIEYAIVFGFRNRQYDTAQNTHITLEIKQKIANSSTGATTIA